MRPCRPLHTPLPLIQLCLQSGRLALTVVALHPGLACMPLCCTVCMLQCTMVVHFQLLIHGAAHSQAVLRCFLLSSLFEAAWPHCGSMHLLGCSARVLLRHCSLLLRGAALAGLLGPVVALSRIVILATLRLLARGLQAASGWEASQQAMSTAGISERQCTRCTLLRHKHGFNILPQWPARVMLPAAICMMQAASMPAPKHSEGLAL